jgi:hypothetical protein
MKTGGFHFIDRATVRYPPVQRLNAGVTHYAPMATLVELAVNTATGEVEILSHHSLLDCGPQVVPALVSGQIQGGVAMGIRPCAARVPAALRGRTRGWHVELEPLPAPARVRCRSMDADRRKSCHRCPTRIHRRASQKVTMIAVVPAIANAVHHAIGKRFYELPITPEKIMAALS